MGAIGTEKLRFS